jgi:hypothetical protein
MPTMGNVALAGAADVSGRIVGTVSFCRGDDADYFFMRLFTARNHGIFGSG